MLIERTSTSIVFYTFEFFVEMALSNFLVTAAALGAAAMLLGGDLRRASTNLRRNVRVMRTWLSETEEAVVTSNEMKRQTYDDKSAKMEDLSKSKGEDKEK